MGLANVAFDICVPHDADTIAGHIAHALSLGLPQADAAPIRSLTIIANGPSAANAPLHGETLALNGAIKLFLNSGRVPTYWAACDPQAIVADFLPDQPPMDTIYFVASKCHPAVFEKLRGRDVRLWHIDDHPIPQGLRSVACASSVTLVIMSLMRNLGYRAFETYGWDACYEGLVHHASEPTLAAYPAETTIDLAVGAEQVTIPARPKTLSESLLFKTAQAIQSLALWIASRKPIPQPTQDFQGGRWFKTSRTWAAEAQDATVQIHHADYSVTIHGDGLIKAILEAKGIRAGSRDAPRSA